MSDSKSWKSIRSYGIILFRINSFTKDIEYLLVCRKSTYCFVDFILGKYDEKNLEYIKFMIKNMTYSERISISTKSFDDLWSELYNNSRNPSGAFYDYVCAKFNKILHTFLLYNTSLICSYKYPEWGFPKGRPNNNEDPFDCAIRELYEETRIKRGTYNIIPNILPFEEKYVGTNGHSYRNVFFVGNAFQDCVAFIDKTNSSQVREIGYIKWMKFDDAIRIFRTHETSKRCVLQAVNECIMNMYIRNRINENVSEILSDSYSSI
tara:strand:- start:8403 stop:9194 length:792 start_codon:yes stop_codon:yes gene_type:complete